MLLDSKHTIIPSIRFNLTFESGIRKVITVKTRDTISCSYKKNKELFSITGVVTKIGCNFNSSLGTVGTIAYLQIDGTSEYSGQVEYIKSNQVLDITIISTTDVTDNVVCSVDNEDQKVTLIRENEVGVFQYSLDGITWRAANGAQGMSAYECAVALGYVGTEEEWLASLKGEPGEPGALEIYKVFNSIAEAEENRNLIPKNKLVSVLTEPDTILLVRNGTDDGGVYADYTDESDPVIVRGYDYVGFLSVGPRGPKGDPGKDGKDGKGYNYRIIADPLIANKWKLQRSEDEGKTWIDIEGTIDLSNTITTLKTEIETEQAERIAADDAVKSYVDTQYVKKTQKVAGIELSGDINTSDLQTALELRNMAHANRAQGSTTINTIDSIIMNELTVSGNATVTSSDAIATLTREPYRPSGTVKGEAINGGSIEVTVKDAPTATAATLIREAYTPTGDVAGTVSVPKSADMTKSDDGFQIEGTVSKPSITVTPVNTTVIGSVKTTGTLPTYTEGAFNGGSFTKGTAVKATTEGIVATVGTGEDAETLIFSAAATDDVMDHDAVFNAATYEGALFTQGSMPTFEQTTVVGSATATLDNAPTFIGEKYIVNLTNEDANISATFTGREIDDFRVTGVDYYKQEIDTQKFTGTTASLTFEGVEVSNALVTAVTYKKADDTAAFSENVTPTVNNLITTPKDIDIVVTPETD